MELSKELQEKKDKIMRREAEIDYAARMKRLDRLSENQNKTSEVEE